MLGPNITGSIGFTKIGDSLLKEQGALYNSTISNNIPSGGTNSSKSYGIGFDASRANSIYKNTNVQVASLKSLFLIKI